MFVLNKNIKKVIVIAGVAINGSQIVPAIKSGHIVYGIERYVRTGGGGTDSEGNPIPEIWDWVSAGTRSTNARITGTISVPSSKMKIQGVNVAKVDDVTIEQWVEDQPLSLGSNERISSYPDKTSDFGQGLIISGSTKGKLEGKAIALIGSQVRTMLGTTTTIQTGNTKMNFSS